MNFSVTKNGKPLSESLYTWDEKTRIFSTIESDLIINAINIGLVTFKVGDACTFITGSKCNFITGDNCSFNTGHDCTFNTGHDCTFKTFGGCSFVTKNRCNFDTQSNCTFKTLDYCRFYSQFHCTFTTGAHCTFSTIDECTFNTGSCCTFIAGTHCAFKTAHDCTFNTAQVCTFDTQDHCTFKTGAGCTFDTGYRCTFKTGHSCTFSTENTCNFDVGEDCLINTSHASTVSVLGKCGIRNKSTSEIFTFLTKCKEATLAPYPFDGIVKNGYYYRKHKKQFKAIIADGILSEVLEHKGNVYKVRSMTSKVYYVVQDGDIYAHGETIKEAKEDLIYKISNRDISQYEDYTLDTEVSKKEAIRMYRCITGACELGAKMFVSSLHTVPENLTVREIIEITEGQYGNEKFKDFFKKC